MNKLIDFILAREYNVVMINKAASQLAKLSWKKRKEKMTPEQISERARGFVNKRWAKVKEVENGKDKE